MTTPDIPDLCRRLRRAGLKSSIEAAPILERQAATLERQAAEIERLRRNVLGWARRIDAIWWDRNTDALDGLISEMRQAAFTGQDT